MKNFRRSLKGISPIFATLILIAIAVIAGVVVYMFTSGMLSGMTASSSAGQEKIAVQSAYVSGTELNVIAQHTGGPVPVATGIILRDATGNQVGGVIALGTTSGQFAAATKGDLITFTGTWPSTGITSGAPYTAVLVTAAGGSFVSPAFNAP